MRLDLNQVSEPVMARARKRLGVISAVLAGVLFVSAFSGLIWFGVGGTDLVYRYDQKLEVLTPLLWLLLAGVAAMRRVPDRTALQIGRITLVLICFVHVLVLTLNHTERWAGFPVLAWNTVFIAVYPLLIPSTPRATVAVALTATASAPFALLTAAVAGVPLLPTDYLAVSIAPAIAATIAILGSRLIYQTTVDLAVLREHERLLQAVLSGTSEAFVLRDPEGQILLHNPPASILLGAGFDAGPPQLRAALDAGMEGLVIAELNGRRESFFVTHHTLQLNGVPHRLLLVRTLTAALDEAEVESWKKLIRALSHELNNTLAPMSSTLHSVEMMLDRPEHRERLDGALASMRERVEHLGSFLMEYAAFARLPTPRPTEVVWHPFLSRLEHIAEFRVEGPLPSAAGHFDAAQIEQVLLNLLKNAAEAGGALEHISVTVNSRDGGFEIAVLDRGQGLSVEAAERAMLPFWSTKPDGTGLGLALCRDILGAHNGWLSLGSRTGGGAIARIWLPGQPQR